MQRSGWPNRDFANRIHRKYHVVYLGGSGVTGILPVVHGGTGADNAAGARANLGAASVRVNSDVTAFNGLEVLAAPPDPASGFGGLAYKAGSTFWYWNGAGWTTVDFAAASVSSVAGTANQVLINGGTAPQSGCLTLS